jgi:exopolyphosphatase/guanosine-5'-triphosphate,3'-diphosphate pyrophosphatase
MQKDEQAGELRWFPKKKQLEQRLTPAAEPLFGEVAQARFDALASAMEAEAQVRYLRQPSRRAAG